MCNYSSVPVSKHNSFPSASRAWQRIAFFAASYGGELDHAFYQQLLAHNDCVQAIAQLQAAGYKFHYRNCRHWAIDCCGAFEVTHPQYVRPAGSSCPQATVLYATFNKLFGFE